MGKRGLVRAYNATSGGDQNGRPFCARPNNFATLALVHTLARARKRDVRLADAYTEFELYLSFVFMPAIDRPRLLQLPTKILGKRCVLRPYRSGDGAAAFSAIMEDVDDLMQWMAWPKHHKGADDSENYVRDMAGKWQTRESLVMGIFSLDEKTLYGGTGFHGFDWAVPSLEIGWYLRKSARGQGIATEAVELCCKLAFDHMKVNRVWGSCDALNYRSWKLFERVGFAREAHLRSERRDHHGQIRDTFVYGMLARDWGQRAAGAAA